ncbi:MAG: AsmA family protein [Acidobacteriia bacterium]|nr:AsmA family protein [Terriglobia bacterium]
MRKRKWLRWALIVAVLTVAASAAFSRALQTAAARRYLITRLVASFGRPVDVARFDFSLLDGARLEAHSVTVSEDPDFGNEYFLRAETLTAGLRWGALLSGRFEFGSVTLSRPSLNLVRDAEGHWNIERWLPPAPSGASRPGFVGPIAASSGAQAERLYRIDVDAGRINFKQREDKSPFALLDVSGNVERDSAGRWQLDLQARPMRAGIELQDIGMLRLRGTIAGTSARLQPAELNLTWRAASVADALRIVRQKDYGIRGELALDLSARVGPPDVSSPSAASSGGAQWSISGVAHLTGIHAWNLPGRDTDPGANLSLDAAWRLGEARAEIRKLLLEMPGSHLEGTGDVDWARGIHPQLHIESSTLGLQDVLSWYRALRPDVAEDLRAEGSLGVDVTLGGWPLQLQRGAIASAGGALTAKSLPAPLRFGAVNAGVSRGGLDFAPTEFSFASGSLNAVAKTDAGATDVSTTSSFLLRGSIFSDSGGVFRWPPNWNCSIEGATPRAQDWLTISHALAQPLNQGWTGEGGISVKMRGARQSDAPAAVWLGTLDFRGLAVSLAHMNQPVRLLKTHVEYSVAGQTITVTAAGALGAAWHGSISRKPAVLIPSDSGAPPRPQWTFDLTADRLDMAELDRWLGPRARPGFLARLTGFGSAAAAAPLTDAGVARLAAQGRLRIAELDLTPMRFDQFDAAVELDGRALKIRNAKADFFGGKVSGTLDANLLADPSYDFQGRFDRVNLAQLARAVPPLTSRVAGTSSGTLSLSTHGIGREALIASMEGKGTLDARNVQISGLDFTAAPPGAAPANAQESPSTSFSSVAGNFRILSRGIALSDFVLVRAQVRLQAAGRIDFSHELDIRISPSIPNNQTSLQPVSAAPPGFLLSGTIENPKLALASPATKPAPRRGGR